MAKSCLTLYLAVVISLTPTLKHRLDFFFGA